MNNKGIETFSKIKLPTPYKTRYIAILRQKNYSMVKVKSEFQENKISGFSRSHHQTEIVENKSSNLRIVKTGKQNCKKLVFFTVNNNLNILGKTTTTTSSNKNGTKSIKA